MSFAGRAAMPVEPTGRRRSGAGLILVLFLVVATGADARPPSWLGVRIRDLSEQEMDELSVRHGIREGFGVVIVDVMEDTPAKKAGLKSGDIVVAFEDRPVVETRMLQQLIAAATPEAESRLTVLRPEGRRLVSVRLAPMPRAVVGQRIASEFGFLLRDVETLAQMSGQPSEPSPSVTAVIPGSAAEKGGLEVGDVILRVNAETVATREALGEAMADASADRPLRLLVRRGPARLSLTLPAAAGTPP